MSAEQRENLEAILRQSGFPAGSDVSEQRRQPPGALLLSKPRGRASRSSLATSETVVGASLA
jgi:hypothetical protein